MSPETTTTETPNSEAVQTDGLAFAAGFFFSFRTAIVLFSVRMLGTEPKTGTALSLALDVFLLGLVCFDALGATQRSFHSMLRLPSLRWVIAFPALSCCSLAWSETASLPASAAYWSGLVTEGAIITLQLRSGSCTVAYRLLASSLKLCGRLDSRMGNCHLIVISCFFLAE